MSIFGSLKDRAFAVSAKAMINRQISAFGEVTHLQINADEKVLSLEVRLNGEVGPITVKAGSYRVSEEGGQSFICLGQFSSSREWLATVLNQYAAGRKFPVPDSVRVAL